MYSSVLSWGCIYNGAFTLDRLVTSTLVGPSGAPKRPKKKSFLSIFRVGYANKSQHHLNVDRFQEVFEK